PCASASARASRRCGKRSSAPVACGRYSPLHRRERRMAVTPTFPSRESLRRLRFRPVDAGIGAGGLLLVYAVVRLGACARAPCHAGHAVISPSPAQLPYYAACSLLRMLVALACSYAFSLGYAYLAARSRRARRILVPALDILQSVPVLGFLAITVTFFTGLFP